MTEPAEEGASTTVSFDLVVAVALLIDATKRGGRDMQRDAANSVLRLALRELGPAAEAWLASKKEDDTGSSGP